MNRRKKPKKKIASSSIVRNSANRLRKKIEDFQKLFSSAGTKDYIFGEAKNIKESYGELDLSLSVCIQRIDKFLEEL